MVRKISKTFAMALLLCAAAITAPAKTCNVYVATNGDDLGAGTRSAPLRTLSAALRRSRAARRLAPPDAVIRLLEMDLLLEVAHRQEHQAERNHGQQRRLQSVEETAFH